MSCLLETTPETYQVRLNLFVGKLLSRVERVLGSGDAFEIRTPSSTASVRGTVFTVEVIAADVTYIACDEGIVAVQMGEASALVSAGTELTATVGQPLHVLPQTGEQPPITTPTPQTPVTPVVTHPAEATEAPASLSPTNGLLSTATSTASSVPVVPLTGTPPNLPSLTPTNFASNTPAVSPTGTGTPANLPTSTSLVLPTQTSSSSPTFPPPSTPTSVPTAPPTQPPTSTPEATATTGSQTMTICHYPPGNPNNGQTITISLEEWPAHQAHGDTMGPCPTPTTP